MTTPLTLAQLRQTYTADQATDWLLGQLQSLGFTATAWQQGSVARTLIQAVGTAYAALSSVVSSLSYMGYNDSAEGGMLTALSYSHYANARAPAVAARYVLTLTGAATITPVTVATGDVIAVATGGQTFRNIAGFTIPAGGDVTATFEAELPGAAGNVGIGIISSLQTPIAGVTVTNLAAPSRSGVDEESDAKLRVRNSTKWSVLNEISAPKDAYRYLLLSVDPSITRVFVDDSLATAGHVDIYIAGDAGGITDAAVITAAQAAVDARHPVTSTETVADAPDVIQAVTASVYVTGSTTDAEMMASVNASLSAAFVALPLGGRVIGGSNYIPISAIYKALSAHSAVTAVEVSVPAGDVALTTKDCPVLGAVALTFLAAE